MKRFVACAVPVLLLLAWLPQVLTRDLLTFLFFTYVFMVLAANYDLLGGFLRYMNLGQGAFFGLAAYVFAVLLQRFPAFFLRLQPLGVPVAALAAVVVTAGFAFVVSYPLFRLRGAYFAVVTFGLVLALQQAVLRTPALTGGSLGVTLPRQFYVDIHQAYYPALLLAFLAVLLNFAVSAAVWGWPCILSATTNRPLRRLVLTPSATSVWHWCWPRSPRQPRGACLRSFSAISTLRRCWAWRRPSCQ